MKKYLLLIFLFLILPYSNALDWEEIESVLEKGNSTQSINILQKAQENEKDQKELLKIESLIKEIKPKDKKEENNIYEILGDIYLKTDRRIYAYQAYKKALELNPDDIFLKYRLAGLLKEDGLSEEALSVYEEILKDTNDTQIQNLKSSILQKEAIRNAKTPSDYKKIIKQYQAITPQTKETYMAIASTYRQISMPDYAIEYFKKALKLDPIDSDIYYFIALCYIEMNSATQSKTYLEKALNLNKDNKKARNLLSFVIQKITTYYINSAYNEFEKENYIKAYEILSKGIKEIPNNSQLHYYRALSENEMGRRAAAIMDFQSAIEFDPSNYMAYYNLGKTYEKINEDKNALIIYERFLSTEPEEKELVEEIQKKIEELSEKYY